MADNQPKIGSKIVVDGEKEYKESIAAINKTLSVLSSEAKKTAASFSDQKGSLAALKSETEEYKKKAELQQEKVNELKKAYENSKEQLGENANATQDWLIKLNNAEAALIKTTKAIAENEKAIASKESSINKLKDSLNAWKSKLEDLKEKHPNLTTAVEKINTAAEKLAKGGLKAISSVAAGTAAGVTAIGTAAISAGKELYDAAKVAAEAGDVIDEASQRMGITAESFQELKYAAKMSGVELSTLETAAKTLAKTGSDMDLSTAIDSLAAIEDEAERSEKAIELFGSKAAYSMGPMLSQGVEGIKALKDSAHELGLVMSEESVNASAKLNDSLDNLIGTARATKNNLAAEFLPGTTEVINGLTDLFTGEEGAEQRILDGVDSIIEGLDTVAPKAIGIISNLAGTAAEIAPEVVFNIADGIIGNTDSILNATFEILDVFSTGLLTEENIVKLVNAALKLVTNLTMFLGDKSPLIVDSTFVMIDALIDGLLAEGNTDKLISSALDIVFAIVTGLIDHAPEMIEGGFALIGALVDSILSYDWWQVAQDIFYGIRDGLKQLIKGEEAGSHAGGLDYVPYDGYRAVLHKGERVLTASEAIVHSKESSGMSTEVEELSRKVDALVAQKSGPTNVNIVAKGSSGAVIRAMKLEVEKEDKRSTAFDD